MSWMTKQGKHCWTKSLIHDFIFNSICTTLKTYINQSNNIIAEEDCHWKRMSAILNFLKLLSKQQLLIYWQQYLTLLRRGESGGWLMPILKLNFSIGSMSWRSLVLLQLMQMESFYNGLLIQKHNQYW